VHVVTVVHARVVDEALPSGHRAGLLEVHAHHDQQVTGVGVAQRPKAGGIVKGRLRVVHRARPGHHEQPVVIAVEHGTDLRTGVLNGLRYFPQG
jgi:hypothetical protein